MLRHKINFLAPYIIVTVFLYVCSTPFKKIRTGTSNNSEAFSIPFAPDCCNIYSPISLHSEEPFLVICINLHAVDDILAITIGFYSGRVKIQPRTVDKVQNSLTDVGC